MFQSPGAIVFDFGIIKIHWYGILIAFAFGLALFICSKVAKEKNENPVYFYDMASYILIFAIIGARLYYVLFNWQYYSENPIDIFKLWQGGLAIHGGIIGGLVTGYIYTKYKKLSFLKYCDITCIGLILGQAIGRWGNFFNSEAFGAPTNLPWKLYIPIQNRPQQFINYEYFHPTFLYESICDFIIFLILYFVLKKRLNNNNGALFFSYLSLYSLVRFFIEGLRTDSLMLINEIKIAQLLSLCLIIVSGICLKVILDNKKTY